MAAEDRTVLHCRCDRRKADQASRTFRRSAYYGGWVFSDVPTRSMSAAARYWAFVDRAEYTHRDHTNEPYVFEVCVHCGGDLPEYDHAEGEQRRPLSQGDGSNPEE